MGSALLSPLIRGCKSEKRREKKQSLPNLQTYSIKECVEKSDCHEGVYLSEVAEHMKLSIPETSKMVKSLENKGYIIWKLDEKKERTYLVLTNKAIELSHCQKEKMIEAYEKIISNIQEDELAVTRCTLRKIRQLMEEIK
ncbi:hypothetical protein JCM37173_19910 [Allocoprococcus similis]